MDILRDSIIVTLSVVTIYLLVPHLKFMLRDEVDIELELIEDILSEDDDRFRKLLDF
jgi:hypothetical protein